MIISEKDIEKLAELARIRLNDEEKSKLIGDLSKILDHFRDLHKVDTEDVLPVNGGGLNENITRDDQKNAYPDSDPSLLTDFPEKNKNGLLKIPYVFGS